jgi:hypothetical protein
VTNAPSFFSAPHLHLLANHLPVLGVPFALLLLAAGALARSEDVKRAGLIACILAAALAVPAYWTGEPAEDALEGVPGVAEFRIEDHEESAEASLAAATLLGVVALVAVALSLRRGAVPAWALAATLLVALLTATLLARTAYLGGPIRHAELGSEAREL